MSLDDEGDEYRDALDGAIELDALSAEELAALLDDDQVELDESPD